MDGAWCQVRAVSTGQGSRQRPGHGGQRVTDKKSEQGWGSLTLRQQLSTLVSVGGSHLSKEILTFVQILNPVCKLACLDLDRVFKIIHESGIELEGGLLTPPPFTCSRYCLLTCTAPTPSFQVVSAVMFRLIDSCLLKVCTWPGPSSTEL